MGIVDIMAAPFAECMVLVAIHTYLGIHVLRRRVIFVDLALAQTAALGTTVGFLFGIMPETTAALIFSMIFTFIGAAVFALTRIRSDRVPQEAVIGLFYAIMAASAVLVVQKTHGAEHMDDIMVGSILWVKWHDVGIAALAYAFIGVIHYIFRRQFLLISENPDEAYQRGMNVRAWDFLFYLTFGFVISFSVRVAGVLLVFVFLVAPAIMAFMVTDRLKPQLYIGWTMGSIVTVLGLFISYAADLPSGPTVVSFYGIVLIVGALILYILRGQNKFLVTRRVLVGLIGAIGVCLCVVGIGKWLSGTAMANSDRQDHVKQEMNRDRNDVKEAEEKTLSDAANKMSKWCKESVSLSILTDYQNNMDQESRLQFISEILKTNQSQGLAMLVYFLDEERPSLFFRSEALDLLLKHTGKDYGYNPDFGKGRNKSALYAMRKELIAQKEATR